MCMSTPTIVSQIRTNFSGMWATRPWLFDRGERKGFTKKHQTHIFTGIVMFMLFFSLTKTVIFV